MGESAPSFYDPNYSMGANSFSGVTRQPLILIDESAPIFKDGGNMFTIDNDTLTYFMKDVSSNVPTHNVTVNSFDPDTSITNFYLPESRYWTSDAGLLAGVHFVTLDDGGGSVVGKGGRVKFIEFASALCKSTFEVDHGTVTMPG